PSYGECVFKKAKRLSSGRTITNEIKAKVVFELRNEFQVTRMIKVAKLSKSTYYHIIKKLDQPDPDRKWKRRINFIYHKHLGRLG
ncbi:IS3 family transposase, partial [Rossellomorea aquimaris]